MTQVEQPDTDQMDPRVKARRTALAQERTRTRRRIALTVLGVLAVIGISIGLFFTPLFNVDQIEVRGNAVLSDDAVRAASGIRRGEPLVLVNPGASANRIERVPFIATARVKRVFPGTVIITVRERARAGWAIDGTRVVVVDPTGRVLSEPEAPPIDLPRIEGFTNVPAPGRKVTPAAIAGVNEQLPPGLRSLVSGIVWDGSELTLRLVDGVEIRMGDLSNLPAKAAVAEAVLERSAPGTRVVDVRVPTSPVSK